MSIPQECSTHWLLRLLNKAAAMALVRWPFHAKATFFAHIVYRCWQVSPGIAFVDSVVSSVRCFCLRRKAQTKYELRMDNFTHCSQCWLKMPILVLVAACPLPLPLKLTFLLFLPMTAFLIVLGNA
ncbi:hypothetical protein KC367_g187 [Hortaea werneckii]|nr:hypothetical protein KC367_g187 [Hortaea werneckii]